MRKRVMGLVIMGLAAIMAIQAGGSRDQNESHEADNPEGFTSSIHIEDKKVGKWNFFIKATDKGGNSTFAGPYNIYNDPESDLPITTIINPKRNMHVQGNLNMVGVAMDDDGVDHVEFVVTRGADGRGEELIRARAEGGAFWSYFLDTTDEEKWPDGVYTLTAWAIDINGLEGISSRFPAKAQKFHRVAWHLDRKKPETKVTSHGTGALVAGRISLKGNVYDGNGVDSLRYSLDDGATYRSVSLKHDKRRNISSFDIAMDTTRFEDGPMVVWFEARDGMNTLGVAAHLLFINNTKPEVQILYPDPDATVGGVFTVAAYAAHPVGLKGVTWRLGRATGVFPMTIGNNWWAQEFDIRGQRVSSIDLEIRAEDLSGNVTLTKRKIKVDPNAGKLQINLESPVANTSLTGDELNIKGSVIVGSDDAVSSIMYTLNSGAVNEIPCTGYFQIRVPDLPPGNHTLDIWAKDILGIEGPKVQVKGIFAPGPLPEPRIATIRGGSIKTPRQVFTGMDLNPEPKMVLDFTVRSAVPITSASISFNDRGEIPVAVKGGKDNIYRADVPVLLDLGYGIVKATLRATDRNGREGVYDEYFYTSRGGEQTFQWIRPNRLTDGRILFSDAEEILFGLAGGIQVGDVQLTGTGSENLYASVDENGRIMLQVRREGSFGPLTLYLNNRSLASEPFRVLADFSAPEIVMNESLPRWVQHRAPLQFSVSEANRVQAVEVSTDLGDTWNPLLSAADVAALTRSTVISNDMDISGMKDGTVGILIRVTDEAGRAGIHQLLVQKDTEPPEPRLIMPIEDARVNGTIRLGVAIREIGSLKSVTYVRPASSGNPAITRQVYPYAEDDPSSDPRYLNILMDSIAMPLDDKMRFIFEDESGNRSELNAWPFIIDNEMDIPVLHIILPLDDEVITTDFEVSGVAYDDDAIRQVYWRIDNGTEQILEADNGFSILIPLSSLTDNEHSVTVTAEDIYGVKSAPVTRKFRVSLMEPMASVTAPGFDILAGGFVEMSGGAFDENGIEKLMVSLDNGNTFNETRLNAYGNTAEWFYEFNSKILKDGAHVIFIKVFDKYGISAIYSSLLNVDNTPPVIALDYPLDGGITTGHVSILGEVVDINLKEKVIELRSLDGRPVPSGYKIYRVGPTPFLKESFDMSPLRDGFYNIEVKAVDEADNETSVSRNIELSREAQTNFVDILYPLNGEYAQGYLNLYGNTGGKDKAETVTLRVNNRDVIITEVTWTGYYRFALTEEHLQAGWNELVVHSDFGGNTAVRSEPRRIFYEPNGPWITIDSLIMGDFAFERPWFTGRAGYILSAEDMEILADKNADKELRAEIQGKTLNYIDISFDNGNTFVKANSSRDPEIDWRYRLETGEMAEGLHYIIVRANMKNGDVAVTRTVVQVDKTPPKIRLIAPQPGGRYNTDLEYAAMASDDVALASLTYELRVGDKMLYEVPGFLQGLYFETTIPPFVRQISNKTPPIFAGGATYMDIGFGLSFFEDNVKIQAQYGFLTQSLYESLGGERMGEDGVPTVRYGGHVLGIKILANIYTLPFLMVLGPDWEWLYASFAVGANFSLFDLGSEGYTQSGDPTWMSALLLQIEFPKATIPKREKFRTFSFFTEGQLWFVPTDVPASNFGINIVIPHIIFGLRAYVF